MPPETPRIGVPPPAKVGAPAPTVSLPSDLAVSLPEGDEGERSVIAQMVLKERAALTDMLGVPAAARVSVRFHPTTEAYEAATGEPWFTLGTATATAGPKPVTTTAEAELQFVPLAVLRERGVLERTIRHQLVHVLADAAFAGRSRWVREGAALHFADGVNGPGNRGACPFDAEFARSGSAGALGEVYARARACFERQLTSGRPWREIR